MKRLTALVLTLILCLSMIPTADAARNVISVVHPDFRLSGNFIEPVERQKRVPEGYIGIYTADEFCRIALNPAANYVLMADIDLGGREYKAISGYCGIFDGNGYTVSNAPVNLFASVKGGVVMNLGVRADYKNVTAGLVDVVRDGATIFNCWFDGSIVNDDYLVAGGIVRRLWESSVVSCLNLADISLHAADNLYAPDGVRCGGIVADMDDNAIVCNCINRGALSAGEAAEQLRIAGGIAAQIDIATGDGSYSRLLNCCNYGTISGGYAAGIMGSVYIARDYVTLYTACCFNEGEIKAADYGAGILNVRIIEKGSVVVQDCYNTGKAAHSGIVGGPVEQRSWDLLSADLMNVRIERCFNYAASAAGISGLCKNLSNCYYLNSSRSATLDGALFADVKSLSERDMSKKKNFAGFDFSEVWQMGKKHPVFTQKDYPEYVF